MTNTVTPCRGLSELFDSTEPDNHAYASALCRRCPAHLFAACERLLHELTSATGGHSYQPEGTWAGQLIGGTKAACGTDGGYYRHRRRLNEPPCTACATAHSEAERKYREARKKRNGAAA